jgi:hypothetical protein
MRFRELTQLADRKIYIPITNEEHKFLRKHKTEIIELESLEPRDSRIAENLLFKNILCKINRKQAMVNENVYTKQ